MPQGRLWEGNEATVMDGRRGPWNLLWASQMMERDDQPVETLDGPLFKANFVNYELLYFKLLN